MDNDDEIFLDSSNELEFELDFATACNLMLGKPYHEAVAEARVWMAELRDGSK